MAATSQKRKNPTVSIVPCDVRGIPQGAWIDAKARILDARGAARGHRLLKQTYGWLKRIGDACSRLRRKRRLPSGADQLVARARRIAACDGPWPASGVQA